MELVNSKQNLLKICQSLMALCIVAFGQPAWFWWLGPIASIVGYGLFWKISIDLTSVKQRFWIGTIWFTSVELIQLSWGVSHPYFYIYAVYFASSSIIGIQFGILTTLITHKSVSRYSNLLGLAGFWTLMEWVRLFVLSGFSWNPVGLALVSTLYPLQTASLWGVYGASFWVIFANLLVLRTWISFSYLLKSNFPPMNGSDSNSFPLEARENERAILENSTPLFSEPRVQVSREKITSNMTAFIGGKLGLKYYLSFSICLIVVLFPYIYGSFQVKKHIFPQSQSSISVVLVQTSFPIEKPFSFSGREKAIQFVFEEWQKILRILNHHHGKKIDLIVLPENMLPFGTFYPVFSYDLVKKSFEEMLGKESLQNLPALEEHLAMKIDNGKGSIWMVNNAFWLQAIANIFHSDIIAGLEDSEFNLTQNVTHYSAAFHFSSIDGFKGRYEKRVLVPMGEYIPFTFCRSLAAKYGIGSSFTPGIQAKIFHCRKVPLGISICYEETYGHKMRENRLLGAEVLVNITNDGWFPNSRLPKQHLEHSRLRTVEMGIPLIRACNTGITGGIDCLGRSIAFIGEDHSDPENTSDSLFVRVPLYTYQTFYTKTGDWLVMILSSLFVLISSVFYFRRKN